jgi:hypothetical protein
MKSSSVIDRRLYHVAAPRWDGGDLLPLRAQVRHRRYGDALAVRLFLRRWPEADASLAAAHAAVVHLYASLAEAEEHQAEFGGEILVIDPGMVETSIDRSELGLPHPVASLVPAAAVARAISPDDLKRWGCRDWSDEERAELARVANERGLTPPTSGGYWSELADAFQECMA